MTHSTAYRLDAKQGFTYHRSQDSDENASPTKCVHREGSKTVDPEPLIKHLDAVSLCLIVDNGHELPGNRRYKRKVCSTKDHPCSIPFR
jgi:hypothetical protein